MGDLMKIGDLWWDYAGSLFQIEKVRVYPSGTIKFRMTILRGDRKTLRKSFPKYLINKFTGKEIQVLKSTLKYPSRLYVYGWLTDVPLSQLMKTWLDDNAL